MIESIESEESTPWETYLILTNGRGFKAHAAHIDRR